MSREAGMERIKVFIIDDSAIVRELLTRHLGREARIQVMGSAVDPYVARDKLAHMEVDVMILDIEMPRMDGLTFLRHLMAQHPLPVIILSSVADKGNTAGIQAMELGAVDVVPKPGGPFSVEEVVEMLVERILAVGRMEKSRIRQRIPVKANPVATATSSATNKAFLSHIKTTGQLIAMGASTGGTTAYESVFTRLPLDIPPVLAVIHMPEGFTLSFARRLNELCEPSVKEASNGEVVIPGTIYIAPGGWHMTVRAHGAQRIIRLTRGPKVWNQRPAVDMLFDSVADNIGRNAVGVLMTGMGHDGAAGLLRMKQARASTICQDEASCIVFGMPREAILMGAADQTLSLDEIPAAMLQAARLPGIRGKSEFSP